MFQGETAITIDDKGRLAIPIAYRDLVARACGNRLVVTYNPYESGCLWLFPQAGWETVRDQAHALKGVAGNLGLVRVVEMSGEILHLPQWQLTREWRRCLSALRERMVEGRTALDARARARGTRDESESG